MLEVSIHFGTHLSRRSRQHGGLQNVTYRKKQQTQGRKHWVRECAKTRQLLIERPARRFVQEAIGRSYLKSDRRFGDFGGTALVWTKDGDLNTYKRKRDNNGQ